MLHMEGREEAGAVQQCFYNLHRMHSGGIAKDRSMSPFFHMAQQRFKK